MRFNPNFFRKLNVICFRPAYVSPSRPSSQLYPPLPSAPTPAPGEGTLVVPRAALLPPGNRKCDHEDCVTCAWLLEVRPALWIRIRKDPHHFGNLDPHPHQIKIRIRIKIYKLDLDPHQFADFKPKCMKYEPILALFQGFERFFWS